MVTSDERTYKEISRLRAAARTTVVLSEVYRGTSLRGYSVTKFVESEEYTGFSRGVFIPKDLLTKFLEMFSLIPAERR